jgi:hypothetical protein
MATKVDVAEEVKKLGRDRVDLESKLTLIYSCAVPGYVELPAGFTGNQAFLCLPTPHN